MLSKNIKKFIWASFLLILTLFCIWFFINRQTIFNYYLVLKESYQMVYNVQKIKNLNKPVVTVFGGDKVKDNDFYYKQAEKLTELIIKQGKIVITGGGAGIMQAVNIAANKFGKPEEIESIAITLDIPNLFKNKGIELEAVAKYFFARNYMLIRPADFFVFFPGGIGTGFELFDILVLMSKNEIEKRPVFIFDRKYWNFLLQWFDLALSKGLIRPEALKEIKVVDKIEDIVNNIK